MGRKAQKGTHMHKFGRSAQLRDTHTTHTHTNAFEQAFRMLIWCGLLRILVYLLWFSSLFSHFWFLLTRICKLVPERKFSFSAGTFLDITYTHTHKRTHAKATHNTRRLWVALTFLSMTRTFAFVHIARGKEKRPAPFPSLCNAPTFFACGMVLPCGVY